MRVVQLWLLGFLEEPKDSCSLLRHRFPSKVGGRPAWLNPLDVPSPAQLSAPDGKAMQFLCQVRRARDCTPLTRDEHASLSLQSSPNETVNFTPGVVWQMR